jgi:hypothetical protein
MSIAKPFTFVANTHAKSSEVNANFDTVYSQVNTNISAIAQNATDIDNLENNKADINGSSSQRFAVADAITDSDAINKRSLRNAIGNSIDYISGFTITKDSGSPENTIIVSEGSCYDSTKTVVLNKANSSTKTNNNQAANATYYVYVIGNSTGSSIDIAISTESITPSLPSGYALYRKIGYYTTDSDNNISTINYYGHNSTAPQGIATVVETYVNGSSWYRVWSDKFAEQGGLASSLTINLLLPYKDTTYTINANSKGPRGANSDYQIQPYPISESQFGASGQWSGYGIYCTTEGYIS